LHTQSVSTWRVEPGVTKYVLSNSLRCQLRTDGPDWTTDWTVSLLSANAEYVPAATKPRDRTATAAIFATDAVHFVWVFDILLFHSVIVARGQLSNRHVFNGGFTEQDRSARRFIPGF
jgi:hypothetical protein